MFIYISYMFCLVGSDDGKFVQSKGYQDYQFDSKTLKWKTPQKIPTSWCSENTNNMTPEVQKVLRLAPTLFIDAYGAVIHVPSILKMLHTAGLSKTILNSIETALEKVNFCHLCESDTSDSDEEETEDPPSQSVLDLISESEDTSEPVVSFVDIPWHKVKTSSSLCVLSSEQDVTSHNYQTYFWWDHDQEERFHWLRIVDAILLDVAYTDQEFLIVKLMLWRLSGILVRYFPLKSWPHRQSQYMSLLEQKNSIILKHELSLLQQQNETLNFVIRYMMHHPQPTSHRANKRPRTTPGSR